MDPTTRTPNAAGLGAVRLAVTCAVAGATDPHAQLAHLMRAAPTAARLEVLLYQVGA